MAFFRKLKDKLFKSSSQLEAGLDAIVEEKGEVGDSTDVAPSPPQPEVEPLAATTPAQPSGPPHSEPAVQPAIRSDEQTPSEPSLGVSAELEPEIEPKSKLETEPETERVTDLAPERAPLDSASAGSTENPVTDDPPPVSTRTDAASRDDQVDRVTLAEPELDLTSDKTELSPRPGLLGRLLGRETTEPALRRVLDDDMLEQLEELLITADMGVDTALRVSANIAEGRMGRRLSVPEIKSLLAGEIARIMEPVARPMPIYPKRPQVVLVVGVNGSGKTTTIGKLASQFGAAGKKVVIAAGDTFRAAAVEQLQIWGERAGVPVLTAPEGSDPASLAFDAMDQAERDGADLLMIDTAGRLQNRADLMEELAKIVRVIRKKDPDAPHNTLLVLDATTGQNALSQVKTFQQMADVSGLVMTKLDGTAKGGVLVALADQFGLPIHAIGVGEQIDDLAPFDPEDFAAALTGLNP
ncbi:MAG: signal recognition particle-docking protein FtsY [Pseudomonadota bacterium]